MEKKVLDMPKKIKGLEIRKGSVSMVMEFPKWIPFAEKFKVGELMSDESLQFKTMQVAVDDWTIAVNILRKCAGEISYLCKSSLTEEEIAYLKDLREEKQNG